MSRNTAIKEHRVTIALDADQLAFLDRAAAADQRPLRAYIRMGVLWYAEQQLRQEQETAHE